MPWTCSSPTSHVSYLGFLLLLLTRLVAAQQPPPWPESSQSYNSPMATALIVMIIVFFTVGFISVYLRHFIACLGFDSYGGLRRRGGGGRPREPANRGLDPTILTTFPTFLYSDVKIHRVGKTTPLECAVCISEFADHEILRLLPKCNHVFHPHCVDPWLSTHVTCPVCRANLETQLPYTSNQRQPFEHLTSDDDESAGRPQPSDHDHVTIRLEAAGGASLSPSPSPVEGNMVKRSPTQQEVMKGLSMSESGRIIRLPRSHSTGHSLVEESDRFTLRLPEEVRNKLVNDINFTTAADAIVSPRLGYHRPTNMGCAHITLKPDRWRFSMSPPFISRPNSPKLQSQSPTVRTPNNNNSTPGRLLRSPKNLFRSLKSPNISPLHRVVSCSDIGERSSNRLWDNRTPQHLDLEDHHTHSNKQFV